MTQTSTVNDAINSAKSFGKNTTNTLVTNQKDSVKQSVPKSGSGVNWGEWKTSQLKKMDQSSNTANKNIIDHLAAKGESLPNNQQKVYANAVSPIISGLDTLYGEVTKGFEALLEDIVNDVEHAVDAIENWGENAFKTIENFF